MIKKLFAYTNKDNCNNVEKVRKDLASVYRGLWLEFKLQKCNYLPAA